MIERNRVQSRLNWRTRNEVNEVAKRLISFKAVLKVEGTSFERRIFMHIQVVSCQVLDSSLGCTLLVFEISHD